MNRSRFVWMAATLFCCVLLAVAVSGFLTQVQTGAIPAVAASVRALTTFNNAPAFEAVGDDSNLFRYVNEDVATYLRFAIPETDLGGYRLTVELRARQNILQALDGRGTGAIACQKTIADGVATIVFDPILSKDVSWSDGHSYIGVEVRPGVLRLGDTVQLIGFEFSNSRHARK